MPLAVGTPGPLPGSTRAGQVEEGAEGRGLHLGLGPTVFAALAELLGGALDGECFASPINAVLPTSARDEQATEEI